MCWCSHAILSLRRLRQEDRECEPNLDYSVRPWHKTSHTPNNHRNELCQSLNLRTQNMPVNSSLYFAVRGTAGADRLLMCRCDAPPDQQQEQQQHAVVNHG